MIPARVTLVGPNGSTMSTLLKVIAELAYLYGDSLRIDGQGVIPRCVSTHT